MSRPSTLETLYTCCARETFIIMAMSESNSKECSKEARQTPKDKLPAETRERSLFKLKTPEKGGLKPEIGRKLLEQPASETTWAQDLPPKTAGQDIGTLFFLYNFAN
ncbi:hypothetical protein G9A89_003853 [Geosiphon pyriformis]|nr:hypothetical protein G9A89_003853 [Geosiphon pyriformis]